MCIKQQRKLFSFSFYVRVPNNIARTKYHKYFHIYRYIKKNFFFSSFSHHIHCFIYSAHSFHRFPFHLFYFLSFGWESFCHGFFSFFLWFFFVFFFYYYYIERMFREFYISQFFHTSYIRMMLIFFYSLSFIHALRFVLLFSCSTNFSPYTSIIICYLYEEKILLDTPKRKQQRAEKKKIAKIKHIFVMHTYV